MALGGGTFVTQNKVLPGSYINFVSAARANVALSDRGFATMPLELDWGVDGAVFTVTSDDFKKESLRIFGYEYTHEKMKGLRDVFANLQTLYAYRLNSGVKAANAYATAKCSGSRGNDLKISIQTSVEDVSKFDVGLMLGTRSVDTQTVAQAVDLIDNDFVSYKKDATLAVTVATALTGGTNGEINGLAHQAYLDKIEGHSFNAMGVVATETTVKSLYTNFAKRMRDEIGTKFQLVLYNKTADYEGVVNVKNRVVDAAVSEASLVYWVTGVIGACAVNKSNLNKKYDGEFMVDYDYTQAQLVKAIGDGEFTLHKVGNDVRVLSDINSLVTISDEKGEVFKDNQTIRVIDQIANDIAVLFNTKYLGNVPNDVAGRISLWTDIAKHHEQLQTSRAIENFSDKNIVVNQGANKKSVVVSDAITVINTMAQIYMTTTVA